MKHNVLFIEGLPGSGKTTFAKRLKADYVEQGIDVELFNEGDLHPIDLAWCAFTTKEQFEAIQQRYPEIVDLLNKWTIEEDGMYITAYINIQHPTIKQDFYDDMKGYEVYNKGSMNELLEPHKKRYRYFNLHFDPNKLYIFECVFLQNHITELILNFNMSEEAATIYLSALIGLLKNTNPIVFYIKQKHIEPTLNRIIEERRSENKDVYRDWIDAVALYLESTKYGPELGFIGKDGMLKYGTYRQKMELNILPRLGADYHVFELEQDYEEIFEQMKKVEI